MAGLSPLQLALVIYVTGTAIMLWRTWRLTETIAEQNCPCQQSNLQQASDLANAVPAAYLLALGILSACWPGLLLTIPASRWRHRHDPRCPQCGMRITTPQDHA